MEINDFHLAFLCALAPLRELFGFDRTLEAAPFNGTTLTAGGADIAVHSGVIDNDGAHT